MSQASVKSTKSSKVSNASGGRPTRSSSSTVSRSTSSISAATAPTINGDVKGSKVASRRHNASTPATSVKDDDGDRNGTGNGPGNKTSLNQSVADLTVKSFSGGEVDANGDTSGDRISKTVDVSTAKGAVKRGVETANPIITTSKDPRVCRWRLDQEFMARLERIVGPIKGHKWQGVYDLLQTINMNGLCPNVTASTEPILVATDATYTSNGPPMAENQAFYFHESHPLYDAFYPDSAVRVDDHEDAYPSPMGTPTYAHRGSSPSCADTDVMCFSQQTDFGVPLPNLYSDHGSNSSVEDHDDTNSVTSEHEAPAPAPAPAPTPATPVSKRKRDKAGDKTGDKAGPPTALARSTASFGPGSYGSSRPDKRVRRTYGNRAR